MTAWGVVSAESVYNNPHDASYPLSHTKVSLPANKPEGCPLLAGPPTYSALAFIPDSIRPRWQNTHIGPHGLEFFYVWVADIGTQSPQHGVPGRTRGACPSSCRAKFCPARDAGGRRLGISLHPRSAARRSERSSPASEAEGGREQPGRIQKGVAVHHPIAQERCVFQPWIIENTRFCSGNFKLVWKPTKLNMVPSAFSSRRSCTHCPRAANGAGIGESHRLTRPEAQGVRPPVWPLPPPAYSPRRR